MKRSRFSDEQIIAILKEQESGMPTAEVWTCTGLVPATCLSLCHLSFESQGAYAAQI